MATYTRATHVPEVSSATTQTAANHIQIQWQSRSKVLSRMRSRPFASDGGGRRSACAADACTGAAGTMPLENLSLNATEKLIVPCGTPSRGTFSKWSWATVA